jgi:hypothetical protein
MRRLKLGRRTGGRCAGETALEARQRWARFDRHAAACEIVATRILRRARQIEQQQQRLKPKPKLVVSYSSGYWAPTDPWRIGQELQDRAEAKALRLPDGEYRVPSGTLVRFCPSGILWRKP